MYFVKTPLWVKKVFNKYTWHINTENKELYLTFDDGPHPVATPFVLKQLDQYGAKASFFCLGKNVVAHQDIYEDILKRGHTVGNHTHNHLNGWKAKYDDYIQNINEASVHIQSRLFRPPYGRITPKAGRTLLQKGFKVIMWDVLSGDFDTHIAPHSCRANVIRKAVKGSIIVFHDSEKAFNNLSDALPGVLEHFSQKGFIFKGLADGEPYKKGPG
ncbi:polysaccharide deacetylase family protein [Niabella aquatica]